MSRKNTFSPEKGTEKIMEHTVTKVRYVISGYMYIFHDWEI